ncbi:MAG: ATP-binding cassette domain-containing protein, partial [Myxococcales bacterium]|nr:ATP-binding cassette domain-containing protein [Myxococcales bacterium]
PIFSKLNLHIRAGEKIGLVGLSGAGKSTLISLLLRYFSIDGGKIFIDGKDISEYSVDSIRKNISVIPQDIVLFHRTVLENIRYGNESASKERVVQAAKLANIDDFIMSLPHAYDSMVGERGVRLSGGQRQRIAIARAILKDAPILILDEATSSLDTKTEQLIQTSLNTLLEKSNTTVIAIAHRLSTIKHMDRIIVLQQGKIIEEGRHEELLKNQETYKKLWHLQKI